jgi:hypothetical protein
LATCLSAIALVVSILSYLDTSVATDYAKKAYDLSNKQELENQLMVLKASFTTNEDDFSLTPVDPSHDLQQTEIYLPEELGGGNYKSISQSFKFSTFTPEFHLRQILENKFDENPNNKDHFGLMQGTSPIALKSYYIFKGTGYTQISVYLLQYEAILGIPNAVTKIEFTKMIFLEHIDINSDIENVLQEISNEFNN